MKLLPYALLGLLVLELLFVAPGYAVDAESQLANGTGKRLKKKVSKSGGQPKIRRTIRVHETSPPLATATTTTPQPELPADSQLQPQPQAPSLPPNIELSNVGPTNQIEVKPEISVSIAPNQNQSQPQAQAQPHQSKVEDDEPARVKSSTPIDDGAPSSAPAPVQVSQEQNLVQAVPEAGRPEAKEPKKDKEEAKEEAKPEEKKTNLRDVGNSEVVELDGVGNQKSTRISNSGNREHVEIEEDGNAIKKAEKNDKKKKSKKAKKACRHPDHNGDEVYHEPDHEHFQSGDDEEDDHSHQGPHCKHPSHKKDKKKKEVKKEKGKKKDKKSKKVEATNIQIHLTNNNNSNEPTPATMKQDEPRLPVVASSPMEGKFVVPVINDAHLSAAVMRGQPQEIRAALALAQAAPRQLVLVQPTPAGAYLAQPLLLQPPAPQFPVVGAAPMQVAPQPMVPPMMGPMVQAPMMMQHHPGAMMMPAAHMMMSSTGGMPMVPPYGPMMVHPAMMGQPMLQPWMMRPADSKDKKKDKKKGKKKDKKGKGEGKKEHGEEEEPTSATTTTEAPTSTNGPYLDQLVRHAAHWPTLEPVRAAERYLPALSLPSIPGMPSALVAPEWFNKAKKSAEEE